MPTLFVIRGADQGSRFELIEPIERLGRDPSSTIQVRYTCDMDDFSQPRQDQAGLDVPRCFGSAHSNGFHMAMCDGSVRMINYSIDSTIHSYLGNRHDGMVIDGKAF